MTATLTTPRRRIDRWVRADLPGVCDRCDTVYGAGAVLQVDALGMRGPCCALGLPKRKREVVRRPAFTTTRAPSPYPHRRRGR